MASAWFRDDPSKAKRGDANYRQAVSYAALHSTLIASGLAASLAALRGGILTPASTTVGNGLRSLVAMRRNVQMAVVLPSTGGDRLES